MSCLSPCHRARPMDFLGALNRSAASSVGLVGAHVMTGVMTPHVVTLTRVYPETPKSCGVGQPRKAKKASYRPTLNVTLL